MIKIILALLALGIVGCSTSKKILQEKNKMEAPAPLDIPKEAESKFEEEKREVVQISQVEEDKVAKKESSMGKKENDKKIDEGEVKETKEEIKKVEVTTPETQKTGFEYPAKYPNSLKAMDLRYKDLWSNLHIPFKVGESQFIDINYLGMTVGRIYLETRPFTKMGGRDAFSFYARMRTSSFYSYIYELDDKIVSIVEKNEFLPIKYHLHQDESKKIVDDIQLFDRDKSRLYFRYFKEKKGKITKKKKDFFIPYYAMDAFSSIYFLRALPLEKGKTYRFPVVTRERIWLMSLVNKGEETISTPLGRKNCLKVEVVTEYEGELAKKGTMTFWLTNDSHRYLAKFKAKVKIGSVSGVTTEYKTP